MKFFARMLTAFLRRQKPDSSRAKPAFIQNTRNAVISTQAVSAMILSSAFDGAPSAAHARLGSNRALGTRAVARSFLIMIFSYRRLESIAGIFRAVLSGRWSADPPGLTLGSGS